MRVSPAKILSGMLIYLVFCQSCTVTRPIFAYDNPARIPTKLSDKDVGRTVKVFLKDGQVEEGLLRRFNSVKLVISRDQTSKSIEIPLERIDKIEVKRPDYVTVLFVGTIFGIALWALIEFGKGLGQIQ